MDQANKSISLMTRSDIQTVKSYKMPPEQIVKVFNALLILFGETDLSFDNAKKSLLNNPDFKSMLYNLNLDNIPD